MAAAGMPVPSFCYHNGRRFLLLDYTSLSPLAVIAYMREAKGIIAAELPGSVRLLSIVPTHITSDVVAALKDFAAHNARFVQASAIVGATSFQKAAIQLTIASQGRQNVEAFDDRQRAIEWLTAK
jgi:hypothetical protein